MYWFPLKVLYSILPSTAKVYYKEHLPFGIEFNVMLWLLMFMDIYWFSVSYQDYKPTKQTIKKSVLERAAISSNMRCTEKYTGSTDVGSLLLRLSF